MKNKIKKIVFVCPYFPPHLGGTESYVFNIAKGLKSKYGFQVVVITTQNKSKTVTKSKYHGMTVYRLPVLFTLSNTPINPIWYWQIKSILKTEKADIINAHTPVPFIAEMAALASKKIPFILTYHTVSMKKSKSVFNLPITIYESYILPMLLRKADQIIVSSDYIKTTFLQEYSHKITTINPGVTEVKKVKKSNSRNKQILFVGGLTISQKFKGLDTLLRAMNNLNKENKNINLLIAGEGDGLSYYQNLVYKMNLKNCVKFLGGVRGKSLINLYKNAHALVLPSINESFGMVLIEAMAYCTPVIGNNAGGIPELIRHNKDGLLVKPNDPDHLASAILKLIKDENTIEKLGLAGYTKVKNKYLWKYQIEATRNTFKKYIN